MPDAILVLNAGSSSTKFSLFLEQAGELVLDVRGMLEGLAGEGAAAPRRAPAGRRGGGGASLAGERVPRPRGRARRSSCPWCAVRSATTSSPAWAHRVVHGGASFAGAGARRRRGAGAPPDVRPARAAAPAAQPRADPRPARARPGAAAGGLLRHRVPPQLPAVAERFALPEELHEAGVRRYGFHGLSYEYVAAVLPRSTPRAARGRTVVHAPRQRRQHVRAARRARASRRRWASACSTGCAWGRAAARSIRASCSGSPTSAGSTPRAIERLLYDQSGLLGVSGISSDMRTLLASARPPRAARGGPLRLPDRPRAGVARGGARRARRGRLHRRDRRERGRDPRARLPRRRLARRRARPGGERRGRPAHQHRAEPRLGVGGPHRRGADDRAPRSHAAGAAATHGERRQIVTHERIEPAGRLRRCPRSVRPAPP